MADTGVFVDPDVSREKFESEVAAWRAHAANHLRRGILLLDSSYPKVRAAFAHSGLRPVQILFGVELDFRNYDMWPPSVTFVNPLTGEPWAPGILDVPPVIVGPGVVTSLFARYRRNPNDPAGVLKDDPVICQAGSGRAFLCMRGVREYHDHPAHSGDAWLQYRGSGIGTLYHILDKLHEFGISHIVGATFQIQLMYQSAVPSQVMSEINPTAEPAAR